MARSATRFKEISRTRVRKAVVPDRDPGRELAKTLAQACHDKKGLAITVLDLGRLVSFTRFFVICSGTSDRHVKAIADHLLETAKKKGYRIYGREGVTRGQWILLDCGDVVVHLFQAAVRLFYDLDGLWRDAPRVKFRLT